MKQSWERSVLLRSVLGAGLGVLVLLAGTGVWAQDSSSKLSSDTVNGQEDAICSPPVDVNTMGFVPVDVEVSGSIDDSGNGTLTFKGDKVSATVTYQKGLPVSATTTVTDAMGDSETNMGMVSGGKLTLSASGVIVDQILITGSGMLCSSALQTLAKAELLRDVGPTAKAVKEELADTTNEIGRKAITSKANTVEKALAPKKRRASKRTVTTGEAGLTPLAGGVRYDGLSAGDSFEYPFGVWVSYDRTDFDDDTGGTGMEGETDAVTFGADFEPWPWVVFGAAFGFEDTEADTFFNGGVYDSDGYSIVPYAAFFLSDQAGVDFDLSADFALGYSNIDIDRTRFAGGARVRGSTDSNRVFVAGNLTGGDYFGDLYMSGRLGFLSAREDVDGFVDGDGTVVGDVQNDFGQVSIGGEAAYSLGAFEPFLNATWQHAYSIEESTVTSDDRSSALVGGGIRYIGESFSAQAGYSAVLGQEDVSSDTISVQIRGDF